MKAGTATVTAKAGGKTASVEVTVTDTPSPARPMTVYYKAPSSWKSVKANYRVYSSPQQAAAEGVKMTQACDGWWKLTIPDTKGARVKVAFTDGSSWDSNGGKDYYGTGAVMAVSGGKVSSSEPSCQPDKKQPMTVWYRPASSWKSVKANYRVYSSPQQAAAGVKMTQACDGWWKLTIPDTKGARVKVAFTDGSSWDSNGGKDYYGTGAVMAVSGGKVSSSEPSCQPDKKQPMTVWYRPASSWKTVKANYRVYADKQIAATNVGLTESCDGWWKLTIPDTKGAQVKVAFTDGKSWDNNSGRNYYATGSSMAVAGGQFIGDVTPVCAVAEQ